MAAVPDVATRSLPSCEVPNFELVLSRVDSLRAVLRAVGELDLAAKQSMADVLEQQRDAGRVVVHLDLSEVTFIDCSCLGVLLAEHEHFRASRGLLVLTGVGPRIMRLLELLDLEQTLFTADGLTEVTEIEPSTRPVEGPLNAHRRELETDSFDSMIAVAAAQSSTAAEPATTRAQLPEQRVVA